MPIDPKHIEAIAYALIDCSMDIADCGGVPKETWERNEDIAADLLAYCIPALVDVLAQAEPAAMLDALTRHGVLTEEVTWIGYRPGASPGVADPAYGTRTTRLVTSWEVQT